MTNSRLNTEHRFSEQLYSASLKAKFADLFGGPNGKKSKAKALKDFLRAIAVHSVKTEKEGLGEKFVSGKGRLNQSDVCIEVLEC